MITKKIKSYYLLVPHDDNQQQHVAFFCYNGTKLRWIIKIAVLSSVLIFFFNYIIPRHHHIINQMFVLNKTGICLNDNFAFQQALEWQKNGLPLLRNESGELDVQSIITLIPQYFNAIWYEQRQKLHISKFLSDSEEYKYFVNFSLSLSRPLECHLITFGVGHTVNAERNLIGMFPECKLVAADPSSKINADLVHGIGGTFIESAVGAKNASQNPVNVMSTDENGILYYRQKAIAQMGLQDFLHKYASGIVVDLMLMDIEGAEFEVLEQIVDHYNELPVPICQLNIEVHNPTMVNMNYTHQQFFSYFNRLMQSGNFALMHTDIFQQFLFLRLFLINVKEKQCIQKFFC